MHGTGKALADTVRSGGSGLVRGRLGVIEEELR